MEIKGLLDDNFSTSRHQNIVKIFNCQLFGLDIFSLFHVDTSWSTILCTQTLRHNAMLQYLCLGGISNHYFLAEYTFKFKQKQT